MSRRVGTRMARIARVVAREPGHTAHWYADLVYMDGAGRPRWGYVYDAFKRAERAGLIEGRAKGNTTVYVESEGP